MSLQSNIRTILITGASSGIGKCMGILALERGYQVVFCSRNATKIKPDLVKFDSQNYLLLNGDVTNYDDQKNFVNRTLEKFGKLDIAFANAGVLKGSFSFLEGETIEDWREMIMTNVFGLALTARATLPEIVKSKGHFLVTSSVAGIINVAGEVYSASKWGASAMAENIRKEVASKGVKVLLIEPGFTSTNLLSDLDHPFDPGFEPIKPEDMAKTILFCLEQENLQINEIVIRPNGQMI